MESLEYDFNKICRLCKSESTDMRSVFEKDENDEESTRIDEMLMACTSLMIGLEDGLPASVCSTCLQQLNHAYNFKRQCESTDLILRQYLRHKDCKLVKVEPSQNQCGELEVDNSTSNNNVDTSEVEVTLTLDNCEQDGEEAECRDFIQFLDNNQLLLTCRSCYKCFTTLDGLKCHKRLHTGNLFKCKECGKQYTRQNHLYRHELSHGRRKFHVCKICNKTLTRFEHLKRHLVTHLKDKPFSCPTCNRGFNRSEHLANHVRRCKGDRVHICDICNKGFNREDSLEVHKRLHENKMPVLPTLDNLDNIEQHYLEIEYDGTPNINTTPFSDSDSEVEGNECLEQPADVAPNSVTTVITDVEVSYSEPEACDASYGQKSTEEQQNNTTDEVLNSSQQSRYEVKQEEDSFQENDRMSCEIINHADQSRYEVKQEDDTNSDDSEYLPTKPVLKLKRKRGRPRKNSIIKSTGRPRGRPPGQKLKVEQTDEENNEPDGEYSCPVCSKVFHRLSLYEKHAYVHDGLKIHQCSVCNKQFQRANHLKRHLLSHSSQKPFCCTTCPKSFNRRDHLMQHMKLHTREHDFECDICKQVYGRADHLAKHKASKHNIGEKIIGEKKYPCSVCLKGFTTEKYRDIHMKGHMGDKKYQCKICSKTFLSKSHLTEHLKFHNENSKNFLCSECGQRFIRNDYLVIHMRRHRGEKPFKCQYCGKGFPRTTDLTVHERYHTGEKTHLCTICGRGFGRAYNLTVHMRTHTGEKPYQCTYCDAAFAQGNDLKAHIRRHTGERFHCDHCSESFLMGYLLTQHKRNVHGLNVVSNIRRLQPVIKRQPDDPDDPPPVTIPLPTPVIPTTVLNAQLQAHLDAAQTQH